MRSAFLNNSIIIIICIVILSCCKDKDPNITTPEKPVFDEKALLSNISTNVILPAYSNAVNSSEEMNNAIITFTNMPSISSLTSAREKWVTALTDWQVIALFQIGKASDIALRENINTFPIDTNLINSNIVNGSYNLESASNFDAKGFQAIDYLINGVASNDNSIIEKYTSETNSAKRVTYLKEISNDIHNKFSIVNNDWITSYTSTFNDAEGTDIGSSIGQLINELNLHFERRIRDGKVGIPAGARTFTQTPLPDKSEAYFYNQISRQLLLESMTSLENTYTGKDGLGFDDYLNHKNAKYNEDELDETIKNQFTTINSKISDLPSPSIAELSTKNQNDLFSIFDDMQFLSSLLKVEMTNSLEVEITYADSDGD